ncbi:NlpC/P60 family protein [Mangrovicoccus algicola]|uniref:C40 family peptidase n=1 Tax=Mangrovicoccus algicola TaxID=2771008 RepID=A0A8J6YY02_9RHOB|nr:NlpC/P60 family protein [Mangrovicoccus algicola]MBE3639730.1 C40 family peptidase [Mangrovicoccus algicola]
MSAPSRDVVDLARGWIGTPYRHQCATRQAGTDCLGLIRGLWRELHGAEPEPVPGYSPDWGEPQGAELLWEAAARHLRPLPQGRPEHGDVLLFRMRSGTVAKHLGIAARRGSMPTVIHAYSGHGVIETPLTQPWSRRIVARFRFPDEVK